MSVVYEIELRVYSHPRYLCVVRAVVESALERMDFPEDLCARVVMAVDEAAANVMRHGYGGRPDGVIWLTLEGLSEAGADGDGGGRGEGEARGVRIVIEDEARQVDPEKICGRDLATIRPGGLGVHIIEEVMDHVAYTKRPNEKGMRLEMTRWYRGDGRAGANEGEARRDRHE